MGITNDRGFSPILANAGARAAAKYLDLGVVRAEDEVKARAAAASSYTPISTDSSADVPWWEDSSLQYAWSGVIGCTPDAVPLIGARLGFEGQYLAVGYNGHGMARIFVTAPALARFVCTGEWDADMPACFRVSDERLARLRDL
jgi:glycine/D-amino acid oxidase-like deaminating enzyme